MQQPVQNERPLYRIRHHAFAVDLNFHLRDAVRRNRVGGVSDPRAAPCRAAASTWFSELILTFLVPWITRLPLGSTCVTTAEIVAVKVVSRVVVPCPSRAWLVPALARFASGPVARVIPPAAVILALQRSNCAAS